MASPVGPCHSQRSGAPAAEKTRDSDNSTSHVILSERQRVAGLQKVGATWRRNKATLTRRRPFDSLGGTRSLRVTCLGGGTRSLRVTCLGGGTRSLRVTIVRCRVFRRVGAASRRGGFQGDILGWNARTTLALCPLWRGRLARVRTTEFEFPGPDAPLPNLFSSIHNSKFTIHNLRWT